MSGNTHTDGIVLATRLLSGRYGFDFKEGFDLVMEEKKRTSPNYRRFKGAADKTRQKIREQEEKLEKNVARNPDRTRETIVKLKEKLDLQLNRLDDILKPTVLPDPEHVMERPSSPDKKSQRKPKPEAAPAPRTDTGAGTGLRRDEPIAAQNKFKTVTETLRAQLEEAARERNMTYKKKHDKEFIEFVNSMDPILYDAKTTATIIDEFLDRKQMSKFPTDITSVPSVGLKDLENLELVSSPDHPGIYWCKDTGSFVTGPREDDAGNNMQDHTLDNGVTVTVDITTGRVYSNEEGVSKFLGFVGVYPFDNLEVGSDETDSESESESD